MSSSTVLHVQKFLESNTLEDLRVNHGVYSRLSKCGKKISLTYDQLEAKSGDLIAEECRGLILGSDHVLDSAQFQVQLLQNLNILAFPFKRFYNYGDGFAAKIDWNDPTLLIQEKLDGTLCIVYFDNSNKWCVATRSMPDADSNVNGFDMTFTDLFYKAIKEQFDTDVNIFFNRLDKNYTFMFELTSPLNQQVVHQKEFKIHLLGARNMQTLNECSFWMGQELENAIDGNTIPIPKRWDVPATPESVIKWVNTLSHKDFEGAVVVDSKFNRIKIKSLAYTAAHRMKDTVSASPRNLIRAVLSPVADDFLVTLDGFLLEEFIRIQDGIRCLCNEHDKMFREFNQNATGRKEFADAVALSSIWATPMFLLYGKRITTTSQWLTDLYKNDKLTDSIADILLERVKNHHAIAQ